MNGVDQIAMAAVMAALCAVVVRKNAPEVAMALILAAGAVILISCIQQLVKVIEAVRELAEFGGISETLLTPVLKITGIAAVTRVASDICKDAKESGLAGIVETAGTILALFTALPLASSVIATLAELL